VRAPLEHQIAAPELPPRLTWINAPAPPTMRELQGRPVLVEFWDFCRANSIRTLPYLKAWHERYEALGLQTIGVHDAGFEPSKDAEAVRAAVERLDVPYPVVVDSRYDVWDLYGNFGWPSRYLFDQQGVLVHYHYGEGGYDETEQAIQELLGVERPLLAPLRPEDAPGAELEPQSEEVPGPYSGPYRAGAVWAVLEGSGTVTANGRTIAVDHPGCYQLIAHDHSTVGELELEVGEGVACHAVMFTPGLPGPAG
jgi:hypothetical protein